MGLYRNRVVIKVGTSTLTNGAGKTDLRNMERLTRVVADLQNKGYEIILVSSGAIAIGTNKLGLESGPSSMKMKQAAAAVGQCSIIYLYDKFFGDYDKTIAQILLSEEDIEQEDKSENLINTFDTLLGMKIIPVVNENDSVSNTEIETEDALFGDNDYLSAKVAVLCRAGRLVLLSDSVSCASRRGKAGAITESNAVSLANDNNIEAVIIDGKNPDALYEVIEGK